MKLRNMLIFLLAWAAAACAALVLTPPGRAGWEIPHRYEWRDYTDGDPRFKLLWDAQNGQVGAWRFADHTYHRLLSDVVRDGFSHEAYEPPIPPPADPPAALPGDHLPTGVVSSKIDAGEKYTLNGAAADRAEVWASMQAGGQIPRAGGHDGPVPDDSGKPSLTVIGTDAEIAPVLADLARPENAAARAAVVLQAYPPDAQMVNGVGFAQGKPAVYLQAPDGKVLYHEAVYCPERLIAAVRKADPLYDPARDPDGRAADPWAAVKDQLAKLPPWVFVAAAVGGLVWWQRRKA